MHTNHLCRCSAASERTFSLLGSHLTASRATAKDEVLLQSGVLKARNKFNENANVGREVVYSSIVPAESKKRKK